MKYLFDEILPSPYVLHEGAYTDDDIARSWPQAAAELNGFADFLARDGSAVTAGQIRMALYLAERMAKQMMEDFPP